MSITAEKKQELIEEYRHADADTGSAEVQVAILTERIRALTSHLQQHKKDFAARRGLLKLVGRRSALLKYLNKRDRAHYLELVAKLVGHRLQQHHRPVSVEQRLWSLMVRSFCRELLLGDSRVD